MNRIQAREGGSEPCSKVVRGDAVIDSYSAYLCDESQLEPGRVSAIYFPANTAQVAWAVRDIVGRKERIISSGSRTGITGGATGMPNCSIISLEMLNGAIDENRYGAGLRLDKLPVGPEGHFPIDPTEASASLGGIVSTNASGARSFYYGKTRDHIQGLRVVLSDGLVIDLRRGEARAENGGFLLARPGSTPSESVVHVRNVDLPAVKSSAGLFLQEGMDAVDLFIGSEGSLGIVTEVEVRTVPDPGELLYLTLFPSSERDAISIVRQVKADPALDCLALEYMDSLSLALLRESGHSLPCPPEAETASLYMEVLIHSERSLEAVEGLLSGYGLPPERTWADRTEQGKTVMRNFRHLLPETVNRTVASLKRKVPGIHKVSTDTAVPDEELERLLLFSRDAVERAGLRYVVFGHIGDSHLHVNMLPSTAEELRLAERIAEKIASESVRLGGTVTAEHGTGRLKRGLLEIQFSDDDLSAMRAVKEAFDPEGILNPGVFLP